MLSRWVPLLRPRSQPRQTRLKHSLLRDVLFVLLFISLLPLLLIGTLNFLRTRQMLEQQISRQMESIVNREVNQLDQYVETRSSIIERMVTEQTFHDNLFTLISTDPADSQYTYSMGMLYHSFRTSAQLGIEKIFDQMFIVLPDGKVVLASDDIWITKNFSDGTIQEQAIRDLIGTNRSVFVYSPVPGYANQLVLFVSRSFVNEKGEPMATLFATSSTSLTNLTLSDSSSFLPEANAYYFTSEASLIGESEGNQLAQMPENPGLSASIQPLIGDQAAMRLFTAPSYNNTPIIGYAYWQPKYRIGSLLTVTEQSVYQINNIFDPTNIFLLGASLALAGGLVYFLGTRLINPLVKMAHAADLFSQGNWSERVPINRQDEIGQLAMSFNHMADELSELYHSLESAVERRTGQLRIASEVAQLATSTTKISDALGRTAELIANRFGFYHVAIYLFDETGQKLVLKEASGLMGRQVLTRGDQVDLSENTLISWVATQNQSKFIWDVAQDPLFRSDPLLPDTQSETAVPITIGTEVLGVLDIQSSLTNAFDEETVAVFQTLANQISSTLQATRLLEATQYNYQETSILYQGARQVIQAHDEGEMVQVLSDTFIQIPFLTAILTIDGENFKFLALADYENRRIEKSLQSLNIPTGKMANLLTENRVVVIGDITQHSDYDNLISFLVRRAYRAAALLPVLEAGRLSKVIVLGSRDPNQILQANLSPFANLAEVFGSSLEKSRVLHTLQNRLSELQTLSTFSQAISAETDLNQLYRVLHEQIIQTLGSDLEFAVAIYNEQEGQIEWPYFYENKQVTSQPPSRLGEGLTSTVIQNRQPMLLLTEKAILAQNPIISGETPKSWMGIPLVFGGMVVGALLIQDLVNENAFDQDDLNLFMTLAPQIATNVRNTQLYTETQQTLRAYDEERFLFNTLLDSIPEGISIKDVNGRYIRASESIARSFQMSASEIIGKTDYDLFDRDTAEKIFREEQNAMNLDRPEIGLIQSAVSQSGAEIWTQTSRLPIHTQSGEPYGLLLIQRDITELKLAEKLAERRAEQVLTAAEIARDATGILDIKELLQKSINLVRDRFGFYHASVFLLDPIGENAVLRESTGPAGEKMLQAAHRLAVGSKSIVGQVTANGKAMVVNDVTIDPTHLPNPLLPDTRSELAIPLAVGDRILGALDVQSVQFNAFNTEDIGILQILADQLAVSVVNSELFAKAQELLGKHRLLRQISVAASTSTDLESAMGNVVSGLRTAMVGERVSILLLNDEQQLQTQASAGYEGTRHLNIRTSPGQGICGKAALEKRPVRIDDVLNDPDYIPVDNEVRSELAIPILFSETLIGVLNIESTQAHAFDENDEEILGALGNNFGGVIANIRLVNQVRQQVDRERQLFEVTSKIRHSVDMDTILETSAKEIARVLGARRASIRVTAGRTDQPAQSPATKQNIFGEGQDSDWTLGNNGSNGKGLDDPHARGRKNGH